MKRVVLGCLLALGVLAVGASSASAQGFGYSYGYRGHNPYRYGGNPYGGFGYNQGWCPPGGHAHWHDTSHFDYHPGYYQRHRNHFHYVPGHYDYHQTGHWDYHH
jgi:hypothetical protein